MVAPKSFRLIKHVLVKLTADMLSAKRFVNTKVVDIKALHIYERGSILYLLNNTKRVSYDGAVLVGNVYRLFIVYDKLGDFIASRPDRDEGDEESSDEENEEEESNG